MNTWILSLIICTATPATDGSYCQAQPVEIGVTREQCHAALASRRQDLARGSRVECINDPALVTVLQREAREEARQKGPRPPRRADLDNQM
jgi:hypothetical protein